VDKTRVAQEACAEAERLHEEARGSDGKLLSSAIGVKNEIKLGELESKLTTEQKNIIDSKSENILVNGVPGSAKTTTAVIRLCKKISKLNKSKKKHNIILLTKVSNVSAELVVRIKLYLPEIEFKFTTGSRITADYNGHSIEISNFDAFIDSQLRFYNNEKTPAFLEYENNGKIQKKKWKDIGGAFHVKKKIFNYLVKQNKLNFKLKNRKLINKIIFDEDQDFSQTIAILILSIVENNNISFEGYGDILQSIWYKCEANKYPKTSIGIFKRINNIKEYSLSKCFRCPYWHCEFLKRINKATNKIYNRKEIQSIYSENDEDKPIYFMHGNITNNTDAQETANQIYDIIKTIMENDKDIKPGDIVVISPSINTNVVFGKLNSILKQKMIEVVFYQTKDGDGNTKTIDMNKLKEDKCSKCDKKFSKKSDCCKKCRTLRKINKIALISGHGFKGGEKECVIAFGLSEMSVPKQNHPGTPNELCDMSLFNVLCSRSKKYLFIGSNTNPSRYITNNIYDLGDVLYFVQDFPSYLKNVGKNKDVSFLKKFENLYKKKDIEKIKKLKRKKWNNLELLKKIAINNLKMPEIYKKVSEKLTQKNYNNEDGVYNYPLKKLLIKQKDKLNTPDKNLLSITDITDKCDVYEFLHEILDECVNIDINCFGKPCSITYTNLTSILGNLPNIIISLEQKDQFYDCFNRIINNDNIKYIDEEKHPLIINLLKDNFRYSDMLEGISREKLFNAIKGNDLYKNNEGTLKNKYKDIRRRIVNIFGYRGTDDKLILLPNYFEKIFNNMKLDNNTQIWNVCLLCDYLFSSKYIQSSYMINNSDEYFTGDLNNSIDNIKKSLSKIGKIKIEISCKEIKYIEKDEKILKDELLFNKKKHKHIFSNGYPCSIDGRIDGYMDNLLLEFKMSTSKKCKNSWILQVLLYSIIGIEERTQDPDLLRRYIKKKITFKKATIYNFITGEEYSITIDFNKLNTQKITNLFEEILTNFNYKPKLKKNWLNIINYNNICHEEKKLKKMLL